MHVFHLLYFVSNDNNKDVQSINQSIPNAVLKTYVFVKNRDTTESLGCVPRDIQRQKRTSECAIRFDTSTKKQSNVHMPNVISVIGRELMKHWNLRHVQILIAPSGSQWDSMKDGAYIPNSQLNLQRIMDRINHCAL